jgi:NAD(P)-dependent dehydrogenase (short-subunit alcohol dehydrogenase family)
MEGFTGSLAYELGEFGVRVKLGEPGYAPGTRLARNGSGQMEGLIPEAYGAYAQSVFAMFAAPVAVTTELDVAQGGMAGGE